LHHAHEEHPTAVISLDKVFKTYHLDGGDVNILKGVTAAIYPGEFVALTGASGSGKSTMLNMVGGLDVPSAGVVKINGVDISTISDDDLARLRGKEIGFVFQSFNLQPNMTAWENAALPMRIHEYPEEQVHAKIDELMKIVGLDQRGDHYPNQLSGGQQQRVAVARALSTDPALILADEPTGNLDSESGKTVLELLHKINSERKVTMLIVTHDPKIAAHADRIIHIKDGMIV
jgi:putative ABC transport system ATP-binding protein